MGGKEAFRQALEDGMAKSGITQSDLAKRLGIAPQTVSKWMRNGAIPRTEYIEQIAEILQINEAIFLGLFVEALTDGGGRPSSPTRLKPRNNRASEILELRGAVLDLTRRIERIETHLDLA